MPIQDDYIDCSYQLFDLNRARLAIDGNGVEGGIALKPLFWTRERDESPPQEQGRRLFEAIFPNDGSLLEIYRRQCALARHAGRRLRFRLHLSPRLPNWVRELNWELLYDQHERSALARSPETAFSRYVDVPDQFQAAPPTGKPRLLAVVSAPVDATHHGLAEIDRELVIGSLRSASETFSSLIQSEVLLGPATLGRLRRYLLDGDFVALHLVGHALIERGRQTRLALQDEDGRACFVGEEPLSNLFLGNRTLRMVVLVACDSAVPSRSDQFSGLALTLVHRGLPAVIAMRRAVTVGMAESLTRRLYQNLGVADCIDGALNETRHQLYLEDSDNDHWTDPLLFMRLKDGKLWRRPSQGPPQKDAAGKPAEPSAQVVQNVKVGRAETVLNIAESKNLTIQRKSRN